MSKNTNVLILEDDRHTANDLKHHLRGKDNMEYVECVPSVEEACQFLQVKPVDIVVLDLIMSSRDGYCFLETLDHLTLQQKPHVIVTSAIDNEHAIRRAFDMGAKYYMIKPYENEVMYRRILDVCFSGARQKGAAGGKGKTIDQRIMEIFLALGIPPHLKGYQYLRTAIKMVLLDSTIIYSITKKLYPSIAMEYSVTPTKVELAIRHTLDVTWQRNKFEHLDQVFGCDVYLKNTKPTNGEFIALVSDLLSFEQQQS
ncbi:MAG TPA: sporulation transcription factor Spo0A [Clostridiales bacterium]|nr:sporulation transcription factor Spo0A [Clostridiales bacterium]